MVQGGGSAQAGGFDVKLDADLIARAVTAAALSYGDDPIEVMTAPRGAQCRRSLTAAASGLFDATRYKMHEIAAVLGLNAPSVSAARGAALPAFVKASAAAAESVSWEVRRRADVAVGVEFGETRPREPEPILLREPRRSGGHPAVGMTTRMTGPLPDAPAVAPLSTRRASLTVGKPAPRREDRRLKALGKHPADAVGDGLEMVFVRTRRERGVPWPHIAKQLGKSEAAVRAKWEPVFGGGAA